MSRTSLIDSFARQLSALIRGPTRLREDIADEIADHLASHMEEEMACGGKTVDAAAVEAEALEAFGDPQQIARELRNIHLGDWIMFQRVMIAALVVIVLGMATTAYFSWSSMHQQSQQFTEMNKQLTSLVELQQKASQTRPPRALDFAPPEKSKETATAQQRTLRVVCYREAEQPGGAELPAADYAFQTESEDRRPTTRQTGKDGTIDLKWDDAHPLRLFGKCIPPADLPNPVESEWSRIVDSKSPSELRINVAPRGTIHLIVDASKVTWNRQVPREMKVVFSHADGTGSMADPLPTAPRRGPNTKSFWGWSLEERCTVQGLSWPDIEKPVTISGLYSGKLVASVLVAVHPDQPNPPTASQPSTYVRETEYRPVMWRDLEVTTLNDTTVTLTLTPQPGREVFGVLFNGSREHPLADASLAIAGCHNDVHETLEFHRTTSQGEFKMLTPEQGRTLYLAVPWHTADDRPADFVWPLDKSVTTAYDVKDRGQLFELDLAKLGTARIVFKGREALQARGLRFASPVSVCFQKRSLSLVGLNRNIDMASADKLDVLLTAGSSAYAIDVTLTLASDKPDTPEVELFRTYRLQVGLKDLPTEQVTEVPIDLAAIDLEEPLAERRPARVSSSQPEWQLTKAEWYEHQPAGSKPKE